ncbi:MAG: S8 family serine peptidase, partial [Pandoraea sp.]|nr:S8 family serine peptidase [Pandoraea sp.]
MPWRDGLLVLLAAAVALLILGFALHYCRYGFDLTDESFYLTSIVAPDAYSLNIPVSLFGFVYRPLYSLVGGDIGALRQANVLITFGLASFLSISLVHRAAMDGAGVSKADWAMGLALAPMSLASFPGWLVTPSYNSLTFQSVMLALTGLLLMDDARIRVAVTGSVLVAVGDAGEALDVAGFTVLSRFGQIVAGVGSRAALRELAARPSVLSVEHSPPIGEPQCAVSVPFVRADVIHTNYAERGDRAVVGIIDNGIDVLHETFLDAPAESPYADDPAPAAVGKPRIIAVWDQRKDVGPPPPAEALRGEPFGTYHSREDIARYVAQKSVERGLTAGLECHGTHVASIAAGRACGGSTGFRGGVAPGARIVVVIPKRAAEPGSPDSIGYSVSHAAALEFIKWAAAREDDKPPV